MLFDLIKTVTRTATAVASAPVKWVDEDAGEAVERVADRVLEAPVDVTDYVLTGTTERSRQKTRR